VLHVEDREATRRSKAKKKLSDVPVVMAWTCVDRVEGQEEAEAVGVAFFINKPSAPEELKTSCVRG
jgi:response regulator RpfG family c-di-GMP phosphodiesterase